MPARRVPGPTAFLGTLGAVLVLTGLLILLAIPAARHFDRKEAEDEGLLSLDRREKGIIKSSMVTAGTGAGLVVLGIWLGRRKARSSRQG